MRAWIFLTGFNYTDYFQVQINTDIHESHSQFILLFSLLSYRLPNEFRILHWEQRDGLAGKITV